MWEFEHCGASCDRIGRAWTKTKSQEWKLPFIGAGWGLVVFRFCFLLVGLKSIYISVSFANGDDVQNKVKVMMKGREMRSRVHRFFCVRRAVEQVFREATSLRHVQDAGGHQLSREPVEALVQPHAAAGVAALYVPAPPTAKLMQAQQLRHLLHGHGTRDILQNKPNWACGHIVWAWCEWLKKKKTLQVFLQLPILLPVCLQRWAAGRPAAPSLSAAWPARCEPPSDGLCGSCPPQTPPLHEKQSKKGQQLVLRREITHCSYRNSTWKLSIETEWMTVDPSPLPKENKRVALNAVSQIGRSNDPPI